MMVFTNQDRTFVSIVGAGVVWMQGGGTCAALVFPAAQFPPLIVKIHYPPCWSTTWKRASSNSTDVFQKYWPAWWAGSSARLFARTAERGPCGSAQSLAHLGSLGQPGRGRCRLCSDGSATGN